MLCRYIDLRRATLQQGGCVPETQDVDPRVMAGMAAVLTIGGPHVPVLSATKERTELKGTPAHPGATVPTPCHTILPPTTTHQPWRTKTRPPPRNPGARQGPPTSPLLAWYLHVASVTVTTFDSSLDRIDEEKALAYFLLKEMQILCNETCRYLMRDVCRCEISQGHTVCRCAISEWRTGCCCEISQRQTCFQVLLHHYIHLQYTSVFKHGPLRICLCYGGFGLHT